MNKNEYWVSLNDHQKFLSLMCVHTKRFVPKEDHENYACLGYFKRENINYHNLPEWLFTIDETLLKKFIDDKTDPFVKMAIEDAKEKGIL